MLSSDAWAGSSGWMSRGACLSQDPELFFPIAAKGAGLRQINAAKAVCRRCAVRAACLSYGLETWQDGIWGGTTWEERLAMREPPDWPGRRAAGAQMAGERGARDAASAQVAPPWGASQWRSFMPALHRRWTGAAASHGRIRGRGW
jgi:WhiB family redox-sensing transcriptional regulator